MYTHVHKHTGVPDTQTYTHKHTHTTMHTNIPIDTHMHRHIHIAHIHVHTCTCRYTCTYTSIHVHTHRPHTGNITQGAEAPDRMVSAGIWPAPQCPRHTSPGGICSCPRMKTQGSEGPDYLFEGFPCCSQEGVLGSGSSHLFSKYKSPRRGRAGRSSHSRSTLLEGLSCLGLYLLWATFFGSRAAGVWLPGGDDVLH